MAPHGKSEAGPRPGLAAQTVARQQPAQERPVGKRGRRARPQHAAQAPGAGDHIVQMMQAGAGGEFRR